MAAWYGQMINRFVMIEELLPNNVIVASFAVHIRSCEVREVSLDLGFCQVHCLQRRKEMTILSTRQNSNANIVFSDSQTTVQHFIEKTI